MEFMDLKQTGKFKLLGIMIAGTKHDEEDLGIHGNDLQNKQP